VAEMALIGKALGRYNLYLGGNAVGSRLARLTHENINEAEILAILRQWISRWTNERHPRERFGDFFTRVESRHES
jgi:sulfite reductase (NADPH) hemoprotein beta-component